MALAAYSHIINDVLAAGDQAVVVSVRGRSARAMGILGGTENAQKKGHHYCAAAKVDFRQPHGSSHALVAQAPPVLVRIPAECCRDGDGWLG